MDLCVLIMDALINIVIAAVVFGVMLYALFTFQIQPFGLHYIHLMFITLISTVIFALIVNRVFFKKFPEFSLDVFRADA